MEPANDDSYLQIYIIPGEAYIQIILQHSIMFDRDPILLMRAIRDDLRTKLFGDKYSGYYTTPIQPHRHGCYSMTMFAAPEFMDAEFDYLIGRNLRAMGLVEGVEIHKNNKPAANENRL